MAKAPAAINSPKLKKLAQKALKSPSMLTTEETRELGASVMAHITPPVDASFVPAKKSSIRKSSPAGKSPAKKSPAKKTSAKKSPAKRS